MPILEKFKLKAKRLRLPVKAFLTQNVFQKSEDIIMFLCIMHVRDIVLYLIKIVSILDIFMVFVLRSGVVAKELFVNGTNCLFNVRC